MRGRRDKKRDKKAVRLGASRMTALGPNPVARWFFLNAVAQCVPEAIHQLVSVCEFDLEDDETPLIVWAEHWGFTDAWALATARLNVGLWRAEPHYAGQWMMMSTTVRWEPVFPVGPSFNPITETEAAFRTRVDDYIATCLATPGLTLTPEKKTLKHFEWLALHHVGRWKYERIIQRDGNRKGTRPAGDQPRDTRDR